MQTASFKDTLASLTDTSNIKQLELLDLQGNVIDSIENIPGKAGSVSVYYHVTAGNGQLDKAAAEQALQLYAEHTEDARQNPGKHPNIDRLIDMIKNNLTYQVNVIRK